MRVHVDFILLLNDSYALLFQSINWIMEKKKV